MSNSNIQKKTMGSKADISEKIYSSTESLYMGIFMCECMNSSVNVASSLPSVVVF
jgi:hypothetical protein